MDPIPIRGNPTQGETGSNIRKYWVILAVFQGDLLHFWAPFGHHLGQLLNDSAGPDVLWGANFKQAVSTGGSLLTHPTGTLPLRAMSRQGEGRVGNEKRRKWRHGG